jgi:hypothetical protein
MMRLDIEVACRGAEKSGRIYADSIAVVILGADEARRHDLLETGVARLRESLATVIATMRQMGVSDADIKRIDVAATDAFADRIADILLQPTGE